MIYSSIYCKTEDQKYPEAINKAIAYLRDTDFDKLENGVYEIQGKDMYAQVFNVVTEAQNVKRAESHEKYLDVQFLISGKEQIGVTYYRDDYEIDEHIVERDLIFYKEVENEFLIDIVPGVFCVFFPEDVHRPAVIKEESMEIRKVVIKISLDLL